MTQVPKKGELYSNLYIERGTPLPDSARVRVRLGNYFSDFDYKTLVQFCDAITRELGVEMPQASRYLERIKLFFKTAQVRDVLSAPTLIYRGLDQMHYDSDSANHWRDFVSRVLKEENLRYAVDDKCGIHPQVDREFDRNIATAIAGLGSKRYEAARKAFEVAQAELDQTPADTKGAIRNTFEALETLTKLIDDSGKALTSRFVQAELEPRVQRLYSSDVVAKMVSTRMAQSFADWIDAAHPYRHGHNAEEPVRPPDELAILLVSQGASFVRWLVDFDTQTNLRGK